MQTISIYNRKGGVGKTSIVGAISAELTLHDKKILMIDSDSQANLSIQFMSKDTEFKYELADYLYGVTNAESIIYNTDYENLYIIPSKTMLNGGRLANWTDSESSKMENRDIVNYLIQDLQPFNFDYIIVDMPPSYSELDKKFILASDEVIPVLQLAQSSIDGLVNFYPALQRLKGRNTKPLCNKIIFNQFDKRKIVQKNLLQSIEKTESKKFFIPNEESFRKAEYKREALQENDIKEATQDALNEIVKELLGEN